MARKGFPVHRQNLIFTPGRSWFEGFLKRHPNIKERYAESVSKARAAVSRESIHSWYEEESNYLKQEKFEDILEDPRRIFNADEAGFLLCPKTGKVLGPAKLKEDFCVRVTSEKEQITVMATFSADGKYAPSLLVCPYKRIPQAIAESVPDNWSLGRSDKGWMTSAVFYEYISNHLLEYLKTNDIKSLYFYLLMVIDHTLLQLLAVFRPLKAGWTSEVRRWKFDNFPKYVTRYTFETVLKPVFDKYATKRTIENEFRKSGLYPFDRNNVDYPKCRRDREPSQEKNELNTYSDATKRETMKSLHVLENKIDTECCVIQTTKARRLWFPCPVLCDQSEARRRCARNGDYQRGGRRWRLPSSENFSRFIQNSTLEHSNQDTYIHSYFVISKSTINTSKIQSTLEAHHNPNILDLQPHNNIETRKKGGVAVTR
nr:unnamed protein product [Callosobruchus chinensis]